MKAVIMAGGLGQRLRPLTKVIPKPLLPLGERSIIDKLIESLSRAGVKDVIVATNFRSEMFQDYFAEHDLPVNVKISKETDPLGTAGHLSLLQKDLEEAFFVLNGDILTNIDFAKVYAMHLSGGADMTIVTKVVETPLQYGVVESDGHKVLNIHEKPNIQSEILAGIYILSPKILEFIPFNQKTLMTDVVKDAVGAGCVVQKYVLEDYWLDVGQMENYKKAVSDITQGHVK